MMASWLAGYRALLLLAGMVGLFLTSQVIEHRGDRNVRPLLVLCVGALIYVGVKLTVSFVRGTPAVFVVTRFNVLGAALATAGFFALAIEYVGLEVPVSKRTVALLSVEPAVANALIWLDVTHFWIPVGRDARTVSGYAWELTGVAIANQLYMNVLLVVAISLLVWFGRHSDEAFDNQVRMLVVAGGVALFGNMAYYLGWVPVNPLPIAFVLSGVVIAWAILWEGFLDLTPIGRGTVIDSLDSGVLTVDNNHRLVDINDSGAKLFGFEPDDSLVGRHVDEILQDRPALEERYWSVVEAGSDREFEVEVDGRYYAVEVTRLLTAGTAVLGRSIIVRDMTDRTLREQELQKFKQAVEHAGYGIMITDTDGTITFVNDAMEAQTGYAVDELIGATPSLVSSGEHDAAFFGDVWETILDGDVWEGEVVNERKTGDRYTVNQTIAPITDDGDVLAFVSVNHEITERKEHERRIQEQRDGLELLNRMVRHDIRNDLQLVLAWGEMLHQDVDGEQREYAERVLESAENAVDLTTDARELAEVMLKSETEYEAVALEQALTSSVERIQNSAGDAVVEVDGSIPDTEVRADEMLTSVFRNLLRNALQHNDEKVPAVRVSVTDFENRVEIRVADNGPGIPDAEKGAIFGKGEKGLDSGGTGIGLYLVETVVDDYGGDVRIEDNEPKGAIFVVTLQKTTKATWADTI